MVINLSELISPKDFHRTSEETLILSNRLKSIIIDTKIVKPNEKISLLLLDAKSQNEIILNALAKSVVSEWDDVECL